MVFHDVVYFYANKTKVTGFVNGGKDSEERFEKVVDDFKYLGETLSSKKPAVQKKYRM